MKKTHLIFAAIFGFYLLSAVALANQGPERLNGVWLTEEKTAAIEISHSNNIWNGQIVWLKEPIEKDESSPAYGDEKVDFKNPDKSKQSRKLMGLKMLENFQWNGTRFEKGTIYDPKSGKTYKCKITFQGNDTIKVRGYVGVSLLGKTQIWTRK